MLGGCMSSSNAVTDYTVNDIARATGQDVVMVMHVAKVNRLNIETPDQKIDEEALHRFLKVFGITEANITKSKNVEASLEKNKLSVFKKTKTKRMPRASAKDIQRFHRNGMFITALSVGVLFICGAVGVRICESESGDVAVGKNGLKAKWKG